MTLVVTSGDRGVRTAGLALGIVGPVMLGTGAAMFLWPYVARSDSGKCENEQPCPPAEANTNAWTHVGASLFIAGALDTPVGGILYSKNKARIKAETARSTHLITPTFAVVPLRGGIGVGAGIAF